MDKEADRQSHLRIAGHPTAMSGVSALNSAPQRLLKGLNDHAPGIRYRVGRAGRFRDAGRSDGVDPQFPALCVASYRIHVIVVVPVNQVDALGRQEHFVFRDRIGAIEVEKLQARSADSKKLA